FDLLGLLKKVVSGL
uniref:Eumenine mastoparan-EM3 n=1 Tax=Eumenes micado TaxID=2597558 RepID=MAST3_EUMMI|nr:RecName: Full=Eumenine mastoparan-EM3; Short=EMP-EM3 [Eumenes micado]